MTLLMLQRRRPQDGGVLSLMTRRELCDLIIVPYFWRPRSIQIVFTRKTNDFDLDSEPDLDIDAKGSMVTAWSANATDFCRIPMDLSGEPHIECWGWGNANVNLHHGDYTITSDSIHVRIGHLCIFPNPSATVVLSEDQRRNTVLPGGGLKVFMDSKDKWVLAGMKWTGSHFSFIPYREIIIDGMKDTCLGDHVRGRHYVYGVDRISMVPTKRNWKIQTLEMEMCPYRRIWYVDDLYVVVIEKWREKGRANTMALLTFQRACEAAIRRGENEPIMVHAWRNTLGTCPDVEGVIIVDQRWIWVLGMETLDDDGIDDLDLSPDNKCFSWCLVINVYSLATGALIKPYRIQGPWSHITALPEPIRFNMHDKCVYTLHNGCDNDAYFIIRWDVIHGFVSNAKDL